MVRTKKQAVLIACLAFGAPFGVFADGSAAAGPAIAAQAKLSTLRLTMGSKSVVAEVAITHQQRAVGLMFRKSIGPRSGMLFVYGKPDWRSYWMKNCFIALTIAYIGPDGTILEIHDLEPNNTQPVASRSGNVQYALEVPRGWFVANGVGKGTIVATQKGSLKATFLASH
jgi:uncharacterized membrane protein (UPF0127 family)